MTNRTYLVLICIVSLSTLLFSCGDEFLDKKPDKSLVIPTTLDDFQALLDNADRVMNVAPMIGMIASDDAFTTDAGWKGLITATERNCYLWADDPYNGEQCNDWNIPYQQVFYANIVLEGLEKVAITPANESQWKSLKGSAIFFRAHAFYQLAEHFTMPYDESQASSMLGIPIRLTPDIHAAVARASLAATYEQIISDLTNSIELLPQRPAYKTRPSLPAAYALLARVYLTMGRFDDAEGYATKALTINNTLLDYNALNADDARPIPRMNEEILFYGQQILYSYALFSTTYVDTTLYASYGDNDLRKKIFFRLRLPNRYSFKGTYTASSPLFSGIANDEVYLIRAECRARLGDISGSLVDLNALLEKRWAAGTFVPLSETDPDALLVRIMTERQKELAFRTSRWNDLRRLGSDPRFAKTLERTINGTASSLPPGDLRYAFPLPNQEIQNSNVEQNPR